MKLTALNSIDWYKVSHKDQYPVGTTLVYSNMTARSNKHTEKIVKGEIKSVVVFGMKGFCKWYLEDLWNETFFSKPKDEVVHEYKHLVESSLGGVFDTKHIEELHDLGYLPIMVKALPEGTKYDVDKKIPMYTIVNTDSRFFWLVNYLETAMSAELWKPVTVASIANKYREICDRYAERTCDDNVYVDFQCYDFSARGLSGLHDAGVTGAAHLQFFKGTDNVLGIVYLRNYYDIPYGTTGFSIPTSEHATTTTNIQLISQREGVDLLEAERIYLRKFLTKKYPSGLCSYVSDSYDFWGVLTDILPSLKDEIMSRDGRAFIRHNSGDPLDIICGTWNPMELELPEKYNIDEINTIDEYIHACRFLIYHLLENSSRNNKNYIRIPHSTPEIYLNFKGTYCAVTLLVKSFHPFEPRFEVIVSKPLSEVERTPEEMGAVEVLYNTFGGNINSKGFKELDPRIGLIYGDSITPDLAEKILSILEAKGYAANNIVFGVGSYSYQYITRDTFGMTVEATYADVNDVEIEVFKDPKTDSGKKSARGLLAVDKDFNLVSGLKMDEYLRTESMLKVVFLDGVVGELTY